MSISSFISSIISFISAGGNDSSLVRSLPASYFFILSSALRLGDVSVSCSANSAGRLLATLWNLDRSPVVKLDEAPYVREVSLIGALEHDEVISRLVDGVREAILLAEMDEVDGETIELKAHLRDIVRLCIGYV